MMRGRGRDKKKQAGARASGRDDAREMVEMLVEMRIQLAVLQCKIDIGGVVCAIAVFIMLQL